MNPTTARLISAFKKYPDYFNYFLSRYYPFSKEEIERHQDCLSWKDLSANQFLDWNEDLLMEFQERWNRDIISLYTFGLKELSDPALLEKYFKLGLLYNFHILYNKHIRWSKELVDRLEIDADDIDYELCNLYEWTEERIERVLKKLLDEWRHSDESLPYDKPNINSLALSEASIQWTDALIEKYKDDIDFTGGSIGGFSHCQEYSLNYNTYRDFPWEYKYEVKEIIAVQPKEIEEILGHIEAYGDKFNLSRKGDDLKNKIPAFETMDLFLFDNPQRIGIEFTFNTEEKREMLSEAVEVFYDSELTKNREGSTKHISHYSDLPF